MRRNIYERFYGQGTGGYSREHQIYGGSRQNNSENTGVSEEANINVVAFPQDDPAPAITIENYSAPQNSAAASAVEDEMEDDFQVIAPALSERTDRISNAADDPLLAQIDEFRAKAEQINAMIAGRQQEADSLGQLAAQRATQVNELDADIARKKATADEVINTVGRQVKAMDDKLSDHIEGINTRIDGRMDDINSRLDDGFSFVSKKLEGQMESFRGEVSDKMQKNSDGTMARIDEIKETLGEGISEDISSIKNSVDGMREKIENKVHSESVASYRNTVDAIKAADHYEDYKKQAEELSSRLETMKGNIRLLSAFSIINFVLLAVVALYFMGFFKLF